jgi:hypothetical protein
MNGHKRDCVTIISANSDSTQPPVRFAFDLLRIADVRYIGLTPAQWVAALTLAAPLRGGAGVAHFASHSQGGSSHR